MLNQKDRLKIFYKYSIMFIIINSVFIYFESYYISLVPFVAAVFFLSLFHLDKILFITVFAVPISVPFRDFYPGLPIDFYLPTEPLLFGILLLFILKILTEKTFDKKVLYHPVSLAIYFNLIWLFITSMSSTMPIVSFKFLLARLWFVAAFYFIASQLFKHKKNIKTYILLYATSFVIVMIYAISRHITIGLYDQSAAHWVMSPFYSDHTSYGAMLAMFLPVLTGMAFTGNLSQQRKVFIWFLISMFFLSFVLSYSRAAWLSIIAVIGIWIVIIARIKFRTLLISGITVLIILFSFSTQLLIEKGSYKQESSTSIEDHIQ